MRERKASYVPNHARYEITPPKGNGPYLRRGAECAGAIEEMFKDQIALPFNHLTCIRVHEKAREAGWQDQEIRKAILFWTDQMMLSQIAGSDGEVIDYLDEFWR
jgi:hypothetical protein